MASNDAQPRYPKRKRAKINYEIDLTVDGDLDLEDDGNVSEELGEDAPSPVAASSSAAVTPDADANDYDSEFDDATFGSRKVKKRKRKPLAKPKKPQKPRPFKPFRLMDLPLELRRMVYTEALVDPHGVNIRAYTDTTGIESVAVHVRPFANTGGLAWPPKCYIGGKWSRIAEPTHTMTRYSLCTNLLVASKAVHEEAASILWSQPFIFHNLSSLHALLLMLRPQTLSTLKDVTILPKGWSSAKALPAFVLLRDATSLQNLRLDCKVRTSLPFSSGLPRDVRGGNMLAKKLYADCYPFLRALVQRLGVDSILKVIKFSKDEFTHHCYDPNTQAWVHDDWTQVRQDNILKTMTDKLSEILGRKIVPKMPRSHVHV